MDQNAQASNGCALMKAGNFSLNSSTDLTSIESGERLPLVLPSTPRLPALADPESVGAEKFRLLATRLRYLQKQQPLKQLVVTSTMQGEGKSVISANLAITLARRQR